MAEQTEGLFYHEIRDVETIEEMDNLRLKFLELDAYVLAHCPQSRERSISTTHLQTALMFAIASLAIEGGERQYPAAYDFGEDSDG